MAQIIDEIEGQLGIKGLQGKLMTLALSALSSRALVWAAAIMAGVIWTFTVLHPEPLRLVAATAFCLTVLLPVLWRDQRGG